MGIPFFWKRIAFPSNEVKPSDSARLEMDWSIIWTLFASPIIPMDKGTWSELFVLIKNCSGIFVFNPFSFKLDKKLWTSGLERFHESNKGFHTRLFVMFDLFINASAFTEMTKKESAGTLVADWGIVLDDRGILVMFPRNITAKIKFFKKMEIVFVIASKYFATQKGQIIFAFFLFCFRNT